MAIDIYSTNHLLMAVEQTAQPTSFLLDRYFQANPLTDVFSTEKVLVDYKDGNKRLAPFVAPRKGGVTMEREGYTTTEFQPANIAPRRTLTIDDLNKRGFGESLLSKMTPAQRSMVLMLMDNEDLDKMITRRKEVMAAETMLTNGCIMKHIADDEKNGEEKEIRFYDETSNPSVYTPSIPWGQPGADICGDLAAMCKFLAAGSCAAKDVIVSPDVAGIMINDEKIKELMNIRNFSIGSVDPVEHTPGVNRIMVINILGRNLEVFCYEEVYKDDDGTLKQYIPEGSVIVTAPGAGRTLYGAVTQIEQTDRQFHTYPGMRVPKYMADENNNTRTLTLTSRPLLIPNEKNPWISSKVTQ